MRPTDLGEPFKPPRERISPAVASDSPPDLNRSQLGAGAASPVDPLFVSTEPQALSGRWPARPAVAVAEPLAPARPLVVTPFPAAVGAGEIALPRPDAIAFPIGEAWRDRIVQRLLEILPGAVALLVITSLLWGPFVIPLPLAILLLGFDVYWLWRSVNTGIHVVRGQSVLKREAKVDWRQRYDEAKAEGKIYLEWEDLHHIVIIPSYKESVEKLSITLDTLAEQSVGSEQIFVVLALEGAEEGAADKAYLLQDRFSRRFAGFYPTFHPPDIPGEVRGKSSNEAWAARHIKRRLVDEMGYDIGHLTVTSCDADTQFPKNYFSCLTYKFATHPQRYRRFWQAPIFLYNNIWEVPAPLRLPNGLGSLNHLVRLTRKHCIRFPQSTYSLSLKMADEVGYWDVDVIPEDWHMFLKCFFRLKGEVEVEPIYLPVGNDGVRSQGYFKTFFAQYEQARRHCWGAVDISYAIRQSFAHPEIPLSLRLRRTWSVFETHVLWSSQWFLITVGSIIFGKIMPAAGIFIVGVEAVPGWFGPIAARLLFPCMVPLLVMVGMDMVMRPRRPKDFPLWLLPVQFGQWFLLAPITFFFSALPALDAQIRLMLGKRLEYRVTEKA